MARDTSCPMSPMSGTRWAVLTWLKPGRALDVATGAGHTGLYLASVGWQVTLADISSAMLEQRLRHRPNAAFRSKPASMPRKRSVRGRHFRPRDLPRGCPPLQRSASVRARNRPRPETRRRVSADRRFHRRRPARGGGMGSRRRETPRPEPSPVVEPGHVDELCQAPGCAWCSRNSSRSNSRI
jgi:SAM-dependent methyltransferase